jgi:predicted nucleic acid-binding Zn ribbon protein
MNWHEDEADEDWVEDDDLDTDEDDLLHCPSCGKTVHEDTQQCPYFREWITPVDRSDARKRWIWLVAAILLILAFSGLMLL